MAPASRSDLDSPIRLIRRPPMRPPAPATTTLIMLVYCSPFLLFATYRWLIAGRVAANGRPVRAQRLGLREQRTARQIRSATFVRAAETVRRQHPLFADRTRPLPLFPPVGG